MMSDDLYDNRNKLSNAKMAKTDICLFYDHDDGQEWFKYWTRMMNCSDVKLTIDVCDTMISSHEFKAKVSKCKLLVVLTTNNMLQFYQDDDSHFLSLNNRSYVANILCHTSESDMENITFLHRFTTSKTFVASEEGIENRSIVGDLLELIEKYENRRRTKMRKFKIMPSHIHEVKESIALIFPREVTGLVEISVGKDDTRHMPEKMNPFTYTFRLPDTYNKAGKSKLTVYINNRTFGSHLITVTLPTLGPYQCPAFLSQILGSPIDDQEALDKALVEVYQASLAKDNALESILGDYYEDAPQNRSQYELPTLLHFAAKNGLSELCSVLLDTPGSLAAFQVENRDGCDPADLAEKHGHSELCDYLRAFVDVEATVHACEDIYLEMSGKKIYENQLSLEEQRDLLRERTVNNDIFDMNANAPKVTTRIPEQTSTRRNSEPTPSRPPLPTPRKTTLKQQSPKEFMGMTGGKSATLPAHSSAAENDLIGIMSGFKDGEFTLSEVERLCNSWKTQNSNNSRSIRERKQALETLRKEYMSMFDLVKEQKKGKGVFKKLKNKLVKKKSQQNLNISTPTLLRGSTGGATYQDRSSGSSNGSRVSDISHASSCSFDMCSDSDPLQEEEDDSSGEDASYMRTPVSPRVGEEVVQMRQSTSRPSGESRKTMRLEFLETAKSFEDEPPALPPRNYKP